MSTLNMVYIKLMITPLMTMCMTRDTQVKVRYIQHNTQSLGMVKALYTVNSTRSVQSNRISTCLGGIQS